MANPQTYQVLFEMFSALKDLNQDPKKFEANVKLAFAISEEEKAKLEAAHKLLADSAAAGENDKVRKAELERYGRDLDNRRADLDTLANQLDARRGEIENLQRELNSKTADHSDDVKAYADAKKILDLNFNENNRRQAELDRLEKALDEQRVKTEKYAQSIFAREALLKERTAALRAHTEGL